MSNGARGRGRGWAATLSWILLLLLAGAALAAWGLSRWDNAARFLGLGAEAGGASRFSDRPNPVSRAPADLRMRQIGELKRFAGAKRNGKGRS